MMLGYKRKSRRRSISPSDEHAFDRRLAGEEASAIGGGGIERRVAHRQLERLQLLDDFVERRARRSRPLHLDPADELVVAGIMCSEISHITANVGMKPLLRLGVEIVLNLAERRDSGGHEFAARDEVAVELAIALV